MAATSDTGRAGSRWPFVGRERERAELLTALERPPEQRPALFLVTGEPGIGKTALADHVAEQAVQRGLRVLRARCWEDSGAPPYWPWTQLLRGLVAADAPAAPAALLGRGTPHLARLVPELAGALADADGGRAVADTLVDRFQLFDAVAALLAAAASEQPLLLLIDDLHAADEASLLLLRFVAREDRVAGVVIVVSSRGVEAGQDTGGQDTGGVLGELVREGQVITLAGLNPPEVARLVEQQTGSAPAEDKLAAIFELTQGNPLFVREVTRLLAATAPLHEPGRVAPAVPDSVRAVIGRRLAPLSADAVRLLSAAAIVGRDFDLALVGPAAGLPSDRTVAALSECVRLGVVAADDAAVARFHFTHPLFREVIYEDLPLAARAELHEAVGAALERRGADVDALAHHFTRAAAAGNPAKALRYARRAGDAAMNSLAYEEAARQYRRALDVVALGGAGEDERCALLLRLGRALARAGDYPAAKETFRSAADSARTLGAADRLAQAVLGFGEPQVESGVSDRELRGLLEEALTVVDPADRALRARLLARLSLELTFSPEADTQARLSREAVEVARDTEDVTALGAALRARWMAVWGPEGLKERLALAHELRDLAAATGDAELELVALARRITCWVESGERHAADDDLAAHARLAEDTRMPFHRWTAACLQAMQALLTGPLDAAEERATRARDLGAGRADAAHAYGNQLTVIRWEQGRLGELHATWRQLVEQFPRLGFARAWLALAHAERGSDADARRHLRRLADDLPELSRDGLWLPAAAVAALAARELGDTRTAARLSPLLAPYAERVVVVPMPHPVVCLGSAWLFNAVLATVLGRDDADAQFDHAAAVNARIGARAWQARTAYEHGRMLLGRDDTDAARVDALLRQAADLAAALGLTAIGDGISDIGAGERTAGTPQTADLAHAAEPPTAGIAPAPAAPPDQFRREGDYWSIGFDGAVVRLRDTKGLRYLARLLANPGRELHAVDVELAEAPADTGRATPHGEDDLTARRDLGDAGALLDEQAKAAYRARLAELEADVEEADRHHDPERASRAREEIDFLTSELARAVGLHGRDRKAASHSERARLNVTRAIRTAMAKIADAHPALGEHLEATVRTGTYCSYTPDRRAPVRWNDIPET